MPSASHQFHLFCYHGELKRNCSNTEWEGSELVDSVASNEAKMLLLAGYIGEECVHP